jgi:hypothetical protein
MSEEGTGFKWLILDPITAFMNVVMILGIPLKQVISLSSEQGNPHPAVGLMCHNFKDEMYLLGSSSEPRANEGRQTLFISM